MPIQTTTDRKRVIRATVTGKHQITIPAVVVRALGLEPGMQVAFELGKERVVTLTG